MTKSNPAIHFTVLTLFPELIQNYLEDALLAKAIKNNLLQIDIVNLRDYSDTNYKSIDDVPYGGGDGMLFKASVLEKAILDLKSKNKNLLKVIYFSPQGEVWNHHLAKKMINDFQQEQLVIPESQVQTDEIVLICGRYAGIDQRFIQKYVTHEISIGDFVLSGGELAALVIIESVSRYIDGVLGDQFSAAFDSFENNWLEAPQFTKPQIWNDLSVPEVLYSGNHQKIKEWKEFVSILVTLKKRPDLFKIHFKNSGVSIQKLKTFYKQISPEDLKNLQIENINLDQALESLND